MWLISEKRNLYGNTLSFSAYLFNFKMLLLNTHTVIHLKKKLFFKVKKLHFTSFLKNISYYWQGGY